MLEELKLLEFLPPEVRSLVRDSFVPESFAFGSAIVKEGEESDAFYVLVKGRARVIKAGAAGEEISLNVLRAGDSFGEIGLLEHCKRTATVRASTAVEVLRLDKPVFNALVHNHPELKTYFELQIKNRNLFNLLRVYAPFAALPVEALQTLLAELQPLTAVQGELVVREGDPAGPMFFIEDGRARVFQQENGHRQYRAYLRKGDYFGEMSVLRGTRRTATVEAVAPCRLLQISPETLSKLTETYPEFKAQIEERVAQYDYRRVAQVPLDFAQELLPAEVSVHEKVGLDQVDQVAESSDAKSHGAETHEGKTDAAKTHTAKTHAEASAPFASEDGLFVKRKRKIRRFRFVRQIDEMDCGAACLAMICRHFGRAVSMARIRQLVHTATDGTSLKGLCRGAQELGLAARSVKASRGNLSQMPLPAIAHWEGNHWIVVYDVAEQSIGIADPAFGLKRIKRADFEQKWSGYAALFDYTEAFEQSPESAPSLRWFWPLLRPHVPLIGKAFALAIIVSSLQMILPVFTQVVVDKVLVEQDTGLLNVLVVAMLGVMFFTALAMLVQRYLLSFVAVRLDSASLDFLTRKLLALPMSYFNARRAGDIQRRLIGVRQVRQFLVEQGVAGLTALTQLAAAVVLMFLYNSTLAFVFLALAPLYAALMYYSRQRLRPIYDELEEAFGKYHSHQIDAIKGIETVKALSAEGALRQLLLGQFHGLARRQFKSDFIKMSYEGSIQSVSFLSLVLFLYAGAHQVLNGALTIGGLVAFNSLVALANAPILLLLSLWDKVQMSSVLLNRLNDVFEHDPEQGADRARLMPVKTLEGKVSFQNMGFRYGGPESPKILDGITFDVPPGMMVAIVGRSGSGKTTLIKCLSGLLEPTEGTILFDGVEMRRLNYYDLRRKIGFVLQENYLFDDTIARNIAFGEDEPDADRVMWAARVANAHEFIERLPLGYDTRVGETGIALSGGQRQRVAIARAVYHQPPILVFDEATSALDTESEKAVKENMDQLLAGRTSFVIAHRLSTIRDADVIMVLERGRLVEHGNHDELMKREGLYYYLSSQQLGI